MLKKSIFVALFLIFTLVSAASAADILRSLSIRSALKSDKVTSVLLPDVALYFAGDTHPAVIKDFGPKKTSKRTNTFKKDKIESCEWAFASALVSLQEEALNHGGNAVTEITSNIKNRKNPSNTEYDCLVGSMMVNVAFHGKIVQLAK
jgi:hypothetical protein